MGAGTTTFDPRPEDPNGTPFTIETRNDISRKSEPGANDPYKTGDVRVVSSPGTTKKARDAFGPDGAYIDTGDPRGRDIHGGGTGLPDTQADRQGWKETRGCTRGQNADVIELGKKINEWKKRHPGIKIPYERLKKD